MNERVAVVTGAGTGIGRAAALALHKDGFNLVLAGRRKDPLDETVMLAGAGPKMVVVPTDISDEAEIGALFETVKSEFGRLDVLFNNAGGGVPRTPIEDMDVADWKRCIDVNLTGAFLCCQQAIRIMKTQTPKGGRIINNGSLAAHSPRPNASAYTSTKHAISGLTKSISLDGREHNIACSQLDIGNADTPLGGGAKSGAYQANGQIVSEPVFDVEHCGSAVAYMASLPLDTNVQFMTIMATAMPFIGRG